MRETEEPQGTMFIDVLLEQRVPKQHPLRTIHQRVDAALMTMNGTLTVTLSHTGTHRFRPSA